MLISWNLRARRLLGQNFSNVQINMVDFPFSVLPTKDDHITVQVSVDGAIRYFTPEEMYSMILWKVRENISEYWETNSTCAVVAIPPSFSDSQRSAVEESARQGGLKVDRLENFTVAAVIGHRLDLLDGERYVVVYDFDNPDEIEMHVMSIDEGTFGILATAKINSLGPNAAIDVDRVLETLRELLDHTNMKKEEV